MLFLWFLHPFTTADYDNSLHWLLYRQEATQSQLHPCWSAKCRAAFFTHRLNFPGTHLQPHPSFHRHFFKRLSWFFETCWLWSRNNSYSARFLSASCRSTDSLWFWNFTLISHCHGLFRCYSSYYQYLLKIMLTKTYVNLAYREVLRRLEKQLFQLTGHLAPVGSLCSSIS